MRETPPTVVRARGRACARAPSQVAIDGDVLDISAFMDHHPGGPEIISELRGRDASQMFLDVGHSPEARTMLRQFVVGKLQAVPRFLAPRSALLAAASWLQPRAPGGRLVRNAVAATVAAVFTAARAVATAREYLAEHAQQAYRRRRSPPTWTDPADQP